MVDKARAALIGDKTMYDPLSVTDLTQEEVLIRLSSYKQAQAELQGRNESSPYIDDMIAFYEEKLKAAKKAGAVLIVIGRPQERGRSVQEVCHFIESNFGKKEQE